MAAASLNASWVVAAATPVSTPLQVRDPESASPLLHKCFLSKGTGIISCREGRNGPWRHSRSPRPSLKARASSEGSGDSSSKAAAPAMVDGVPRKSILCEDCDGNGAVLCSQCKGDGLNSEDHFGGRFKAGMTCWLCRGKRQMLCGRCNGAGFVGGFMSGSED